MKISKPFDLTGKPANGLTEILHLNRAGRKIAKYLSQYERNFIKNDA